jgi:hypothetical protein
MIAQISYQEKLRIVLILGYENDKIYLLSSENVPDDIALDVKQSLSKLDNLKDKIVLLKTNFSEVYNRAIRILPKESVVIINEYE